MKPSPVHSTGRVAAVPVVIARLLAPSLALGLPVAPVLADDFAVARAWVRRC